MGVDEHEFGVDEHALGVEENELRADVTWLCSKGRYYNINMPSFGLESRKFQSTIGQFKHSAIRNANQIANRRQKKSE